MGSLLKLLLKLLKKKKPTPKSGGSANARPGLARNKADESGGVKPRRNCTQPCSRTENYPEGARPLPHTKGKTKLFAKNGGTRQMDRDFDSFNPTGVKTRSTPRGDLTTGNLSDGRIITKRTFSSDGRPTLEIRNPATGRGAETRYNP